MPYNHLLELFFLYYDKSKQEYQVVTKMAKTVIKNNRQKIAMQDFEEVSFVQK